MEPKRYSTECGADHGGPYVIENEDESGNFVEWDDYELLRIDRDTLSATIKAKDAEIRQMRSALTMAARLAASGDIDELQTLRELLCSANGRSVVVSEVDTLRATIEAKDAEMERKDVELEAWRSGRLYRDGSLFDHDAISFWTKPNKLSLSKRHDTINGAVAALMAERESDKVGYITRGSYTCNGSPRGCEGERFGGCDHCDSLMAEREG